MPGKEGRLEGLHFEAIDPALGYTLALFDNGALFGKTNDNNRSALAKLLVFKLLAKGFRPFPGQHHRDRFFVRLNVLLFKEKPRVGLVVPLTAG